MRLSDCDAMDRGVELPVTGAAKAMTWVGGYLISPEVARSRYVGHRRAVSGNRRTSALAEDLRGVQGGAPAHPQQCGSHLLHELVEFLVQAQDLH